MAESWDFTVDSDIQRTLASNLDKNADAFDARVDDLYKKIDSMGTNNYWVGEDYDAFKNGTDGYKTALQDLSNGIRLFSDHFEKVAEGTDALATDLISIVVNATGSSNAGSLNGQYTNEGTNSNTTGPNPTDNTTTNTDTNANTDTNTNISNNEGSPADTNDTNTNNNVSPDSTGTTTNDSIIIEGTGSNSTSGNTTDSNTASNDTNSPIVDTNANEGEGQEEIPSNNGSVDALNPEQNNGYGATYSSSDTTDNSQETQEVYIDHDFTESFSTNNYWQTAGEDFAKDWDSYINHDDYASIISSAAFGPINFAVDGVQFAGNVAIDGANDVIEAVEWALWGDYSGYETTTDPTTEASGFTNPYNSGYWSHLGDNFADDWDYSECDDVLDYVAATGEGVIGTVWDAVGVVGHGILDTAQGALELVEGFINLF